MDSCCKKFAENWQRAIPMVHQRAPFWSGVAVIGLKQQKLSSQSFLGKYLVLLFYPCDFSFVCAVELIQFSDRVDEFRSLGTEVVAVSTDSEFAHFAWVTTPRGQGGLGEMKIPLLADKNHRIATDYGVLDEDKGVAHRALFITDPRGNVRHVTIGDEAVPRSVDEMLRVIKDCWLMDKYCPAKDTYDEQPDYFGTT